MRFIEDDFDPQERLSIILESNTLSDSNLDYMYTTLLQHSITGKRISLFKQVVGPIMIMGDILPVRNVAALLGISLSKVSAMFSVLHSVFSIPANESEPVRIFHQSFRDFLLDAHRSDPKFHINTDEVHIGVFRNCMQHISDLERNICKLSEVGILVADIPKEMIQQNIPAHIQYACLYWIYHFQHIELVQRLSPEHMKLILAFLERDFLHWLEAISLMGEMSNGVIMIIALEETLKVNTYSNHVAQKSVLFDRSLNARLVNIISGDMINLSQEISLIKKKQTLQSSIYSNQKLFGQLLELAHDARRFISYHKLIIETACLQLYSSALLFSPEESLIRKNMYLKNIPWISKKPRSELLWGPLIQTPEGHSDEVKSVVFSPNGERLASASSDTTIRLWDTVMGKEYNVFRGHSRSINAVAFSPDGKFPASASLDETIKIWNISTGKEHGTFAGHSEPVSGVRFSPMESFLPLVHLGI